jgi:hypothetical protein
MIKGNFYQVFTQASVALYAPPTVLAPSTRKSRIRPATSELAPHPSTNAQQGAQQPGQPAEEPSRLRRAWRWMRATG